MKEFVEQLKTKLANYDVSSLTIQETNFLVIFNSSKDHFKKIIKDLMKDKKLAFTMLTDLSAADFPDNEKRFEVVYNLLSITENVRVIIKVQIADNEDIETVSDIFNAAIWYEREVWDMFGINFTKNPDLRRILTDYGFVGHPLRKDFPVTGYKEVRYDIEQKKVIYEPVKLTQDFRSFDFVSPWEGSNYKLPGDEKAKVK